jgi:ubiquinone biosynthesis protein COQ9
MEAYEIRLELLKMAKDILMEDWYCKRNAIESVYSQKRDISMAQEYNRYVVDYPDIPEVPTSDNITALASKLNEFVSRRS